MLKDITIKNAKPKEKQYKLADSKGLYLRVMPNGSKYWQFKYRFQGKEKTYSIGPYPLITLAMARIEADNARRDLLQILDPNEIKKAKKQQLPNEENSFKAIAAKWHEMRASSWSEGHARNVLHRLKTDIFPHFGDKPIQSIKVSDIHEALLEIENRGALDLTSRVRQIVRQVFNYAMKLDKCSQNPADKLIGMLKTRPTKHFASIEPSEIPTLIAALKENKARLYMRTIRAIRLSLLTFVRPGELRQAYWSEFNLEKKEWFIPAERMKSRRSHIVPLSTQAIEILKEQKEETKLLNTDRVFPSQIKIKDPMSDGTVRLALHRLGFKGTMTAHGFRALARTAIREELNVLPDIIEAQLAHKPSGSLGAAYDRATFLKERRQMMQDWADYLDNVKIEKQASAKQSV